MIPKLAEEEVHMRNDAIAVRKQRLDNAQVGQPLVYLSLDAVKRDAHISLCDDLVLTVRHCLCKCTAM